MVTARSSWGTVSGPGPTGRDSAGGPGPTGRDSVDGLGPTGRDSAGGPAVTGLRHLDDPAAAGRGRDGGPAAAGSAGDSRLAASAAGPSGPGRRESTGTSGGLGGPGWPEPAEPGPVRRPAWRDTLRDATDLALVGIIVAFAALPVLTLGTAVATASSAVHHWIEHDRWPGVRVVLRDAGRGLLTGAAATLFALVSTVLLAVNLLALGRGVVPGGLPMTILTGVLSAALAGFAGLIVVHLGRQGGDGWRAAVRLAAGTVRRRPSTLVAATGVLVLAATLCVMVLPPLTPILAGYTLLALHAVHRRLDREPDQLNR